MGRRPYHHFTRHRRPSIMSCPMFVVVFALFVQQCQAQVAITNRSCTVPQTNGTLMLTNIAVACSDQVDTNTCSNLFNLPSDTTALYLSGAQAGAGYRPQSVTTATSACEDPGHINAAVQVCPKYCGFCCLTPAYNCPNTTPSPTPCDQVTTDMCNSPQWKPTLAQYCPASCGMCLMGGCVDAVTGCSNGNYEICFSMPSFAAQNCQRSCNMCPATTTAPVVVTVAPAVVTTAKTGCTTYAADSSTSCATWATNGFCTNTFYTVAQRQQYCATTCKLC